MALETGGFCPNCGNPVSPGQRFCGVCGKPLATTAPKATAETSDEAVAFTSADEVFTSTDATLTSKGGPFTPADEAFEVEASEEDFGELFRPVYIDDEEGPDQALVFAKGLPAWDILPPDQLVQRTARP